YPDPRSIREQRVVRFAEPMCALPARPRQRACQSDTCPQQIVLSGTGSACSRIKSWMAAIGAQLRLMARSGSLGSSGTGVLIRVMLVGQETFSSHRTDYVRQSADEGCHEHTKTKAIVAVRDRNTVTLASDGHRDSCSKCCRSMPRSMAE